MEPIALDHDEDATSWESQLMSEGAYPDDNDDLTTLTTDGSLFPFLDDIETDLLEEIDVYHRNHLLDYAKPTFQDTMLDVLVDTTYHSLVDMGHLDDEDSNASPSRRQVRYTVLHVLSMYYDQVQMLPPRSLPLSSPFLYPLPPALLGENPDIPGHIQRLRDTPQPPQRTPEWYAFRHELLTASGWSKAFGSDAARNSLMYEKCKPFEVPGYIAADVDATPDRRSLVGVGRDAGEPKVRKSSTAETSLNCALPGVTHTSMGSCNTQSPLHWGNKYEPLTRMLYEYLYDTEVEDFGCLRHPTYAFLGASPDGIAVRGARAGYMLEIKNVFNRDLTGIPKEEYWVQVQGQLEVCDLEMCDFVETRFKEHATPEEFYADSSGHREHKGVILYVSSIHRGGIHYLYRPIGAPNTPEAVEAWCAACLSALAVHDFVLVQVLYWYLDEMSHVVIPRNREWFRAALPTLSEVWDMIVRERVEGYAHRMPQSRGSGKASGKVCNGLKIMFEDGSRQIQMGASAEELVHVIKHEES